MTTANGSGSSSTLSVNGRELEIFRLDAAGGDFASLPYSLKILLENLCRHEDGVNVTRADIEALANWDPAAEPTTEIVFTPSRVLLQDFTGVPAVVDLAAMRDAVRALGGKASLVNPLAPAELVIDHSLQVDRHGRPDAPDLNARIEFERNREALPVPAVGAKRLLQPPGRSPRHRHRSPDQPRVPRPGGLRPVAGRLSVRLSGHGGRDRFAHHDDQRPRRARLGGRRHRGGGGDARPADSAPHPAGGRLPAGGTAPRRRHRDRPRPHRGRDAARPWGGGKVRRVLRPPASTSSRWRTAPPSPTWLPSTGRPAECFRSTRKRSAISS